MPASRWAMNSSPESNTRSGVPAALSSSTSRSLACHSGVQNHAWSGSMAASFATGRPSRVRITTSPSRSTPSTSSGVSPVRVRGRAAARGRARPSCRHHKATGPLPISGDHTQQAERDTIGVTKRHHRRERKILGLSRGRSTFRTRRPNPGRASGPLVPTGNSRASEAGHPSGPWKLPAGYGTFPSAITLVSASGTAALPRRRRHGGIPTGAGRPRGAQPPRARATAPRLPTGRDPARLAAHPRDPRNPLAAQSADRTRRNRDRPAAATAAIGAAAGPSGASHAMGSGPDQPNDHPDPRDDADTPNGAGVARQSRGSR